MLPFSRSMFYLCLTHFLSRRANSRPGLCGGVPQHGRGGDIQVCTVCYLDLHYTGMMYCTAVFICYMYIQADVDTGQAFFSDPYWLSLIIILLYPPPPPPHLDTVNMINTVKDEWGGVVGNLRHPSSLSLYTHPLSLKFALLPCHFGFLLSARKKLECPPGNS